MAVVKHKGKRLDNGEVVVGYVSKMWGQYHITTEADENTAYPVEETSIEPCFENLDSKVIDANEGFAVLDKLFAEIQKNDYVATQEMLDRAWGAWCDLPVADF